MTVIDYCVNILEEVDFKHQRSLTLMIRAIVLWFISFIAVIAFCTKIHGSFMIVVFCLYPAAYFNGAILKRQNGSNEMVREVLDLATVVKLEYPDDPEMSDFIRQSTRVQRFSNKGSSVRADLTILNNCLVILIAHSLLVIVLLSVSAIFMLSEYVTAAGAFAIALGTVSTFLKYGREKVTSV